MKKDSQSKKTVFVLTPISITQKESVLNKLSWYDSTNGLQYEGVGGEMFFVYDHYNKRMVPRIRDVFVNKHSSTHGEIKDLLNTLNIDFEIEDDSPKEIMVSVNEDDAFFLEQKLKSSKLCKISMEAESGKVNKGRNSKNSRTTGKRTYVL